MTNPTSHDTTAPHAPFSTRYPYWAVILTTLLLMLLMGAAGTFVYLQHQHDPTPASSGYVTSNFQPVLMVFPLFAAWLAYLFFLRGHWREVSPRKLSDLTARDWRPMLIPLGVLALQILNALPSLNRPAGQIAYYLGFTALVAFVEEGVYRGMFLKWLRPRGFNTAVIVSTVVFSISHALNLISGQSLQATALQLLYTVLFGLLAALLRLRVGNLIPLMLWHMAFDFTSFNGTRQGENMTLIALQCLLMLGGVIWLWRER